MLKVMFVDDDRNILDGMRRLLRSMSDKWEMIFLESGKEALEELKKKEYDVVVCDYKMPDMNGLELLNHVKGKYQNIKRILLSGQSETDVYNSAKEVAHFYVSKPCNNEELIKIISDIKLKEK